MLEEARCDRHRSPALMKGPQSKYALKGLSKALPNKEKGTGERPWSKGVLSVKNRKQHHQQGTALKPLPAARSGKRL